MSQYIVKGFSINRSTALCRQPLPLPFAFNLAIATCDLKELVVQSLSSLKKKGAAVTFVDDKQQPAGINVLYQERHQCTLAAAVEGLSES
jgi:hypothetical protein